MAGIQIGASFNLNSGTQNFLRDSFETLELMKNFPETSLPPIFHAMCEANGKMYIYNANNDIDITTGKWREMTVSNELPNGGTTGQILSKVDNADGNVQWIDKIGEKQYSTDGNNTLLGEKFNLSADASGTYSHAECDSTIASGNNSHAEGYKTKASGSGSHAEGDTTTASGNYSHAEGYNTNASGDCSHAEGDTATAIGSYSHAEGYATSASGKYTHAEGCLTISSSDYQHVQGKYNEADTLNMYAHIIGNGTSPAERSNAFAIRWDGSFDIKSPNGTLWNISVNDSGVLTTTQVK